MIRFSGNTKAGKEIFKRTITCGIIGSAPEADTASASIALAGYYSSAKGYKTALAVMGDDQGFAHMLSESECIDLMPTGYRDGKLTYYILNSRCDLEKLIRKGFDRIVMNMGTDYTRYSIEDLFIFDRLVALINTSSWRMYLTRKFLLSTIVKENGLRQSSGNILYAVSGTRKGNRTIEHEFDIAVRDASSLKGISDPYLIKREQLKVIRVLE